LIRKLKEKIEQGLTSSVLKKKKIVNDITLPDIITAA